jgi:hypothetical protein
MQLTDLLTIVAPSEDFRKTSYLVSPTSGGNPNITYLSPVRDDGTLDLVYIKGWLKDTHGKPITNPDGSYQGCPWDWMTVTSSWIRQRLTENMTHDGKPSDDPQGWSHPGSGKGPLGLGVRRLPRFIMTDKDCTLSVFQWIMQSPETDYYIWGPNGITRNTDAGVRCTFRGPYLGQPSGDLPMGVDWVEDYEWGGKPLANMMVYNTKETVTHRVGFGRYQWQSFKSDGKGGYAEKPSSESLSNKIMALPALVTPIQKIW